MTATNVPRRDWAALEEAMTSLLEQRPRVAVGAIREDGLYTHLPDTVPVDGHEVLEGRSVADVVAPAYRPALIEAWGASRVIGNAVVTVRLTSGESVTLRLVDVRGPHGVFLVFLQAADSAPEPAPRVAQLVPVPPRFAVVKRNVMGQIIEPSASFAAMVKMSAEQYVGVEGRRLIHPDDYCRVVDLYTEMLANPAEAHRWRGRYLLGDGTYLWVEVTIHNELEERGWIRTEVVDISAEMSAHEALAERERLLAQLTEAFPLGILQAGADGRVGLTNTQGQYLLGGTALTLAEVQEKMRPADANDFAGVVADVLADGHSRAIEVALVDDGRGEQFRRFEIRGLQGEQGAVVGVVASIADITQLTLAQRALHDKATIDPLTGLHNRAEVMARLQQRLAADTDADGGTAVLFLDLDRFKPINDRFGHHNGDLVLATIAERLRATLRTHDLIGRIGGDEFLVVLSKVADPAQAATVAERLSFAIQAPIALDTSNVEVGCSVGIAWTNDGDAEAADLVRRADRAMYLAKAAGDGVPVVGADLADERIRR